MLTVGQLNVPFEGFEGLSRCPRWSTHLRWRKALNWTRLTPLIEFWELLMRHIDGVVAWAKHRLSNAALKGNNNTRVRYISQRGRGYRNPNNLMQVLYHASWR